MKRECSKAPRPTPKKTKPKLSEGNKEVEELDYKFRKIILLNFRGVSKKGPKYFNFGRLCKSALSFFLLAYFLFREL